MKKSSIRAAEMAWLARAAARSWEQQRAPIRPLRGYLALSSADDDDTSPLLLCDPLTGLIAYPSFESQLIADLPQLAPLGLHIAIGDVDDLKGYVNAARAGDPTHFGHLTGNDCMRRVGETTREWSAEVLDPWPFVMCATFGGDEVIVAAAGRPYAEFLNSLNALADRIRKAAPRPCSFASATTLPMKHLAGVAEDTYRDLLSRVDRSLFCHKAVSRKFGDPQCGIIVDLGAIAMLGHPDWLQFQIGAQDSEPHEINR